MIRSGVLPALLLAVTPALADEPALKPDPPAKAIAWPAKIPALDLPASGYPAALSTGPFVLTSAWSGTETARTVYDLRTGKKIGEWKSNDPLTGSQELSPDGKIYVALFAQTPPAAGAGVPRQAPRRTLAAFDTATGKRLWQVELNSPAYRLLFVGPDRVFIDRGNGAGNGPELYDAKTGKVVRELPNSIQPGYQVSASPGGAYLAAVERSNAVAVIDTKDGAVVKRFTIPPSDPNRPDHIQELAFSPDGTRLAGVLPLYSGTTRSLRVVSWNLATGEPDADTRLNAPTASAVPMLRWSADSKAWFILGIGMVDPDTGTILWRHPFDTWAAGFYLPIAANRLLTIGRSGSLREVSVPAEKVAAALKAVRAGGLAVDGWLPALAKADRSAAQSVTVPQRAEDWTYRPDPAPTATRKPLRLPVPADRVVAVRVVGEAVVCELAEPAADTFAPRQLVRADLATGQPTGRVELPAVARLADVSPGGEAALTADSEDTRRVDVWDLGTGKPVAGWRPAGTREPGGELLYAALLSADRALTLTRGGELAVWSVPGAKAVYSLRLPGAGVPARSPGRKYLFVPQGETVRVIEAATGQLAGDLHTDTTPRPAVGLQPPGPWSHSPLAVRPDGKELTALLLPAGQTPQVRRWDLTTAKLHDRFALPGPGMSPASAVRYAGPDHLLLADSELLGLASRSPVWRYSRPTGPFTATPAAGPLWYVAGEFAPPVAALTGTAAARAVPSAVLVAAELPHPAAAAALKAAADNTADNLLGPGKTVRLKLNLAGEPGDKVTESLRATLADALKARGLTATDDKADVVLTATARLSTDGPMMTVRRLLPGERGRGTTEKVKMPSVATRLELTADGRTVWEGGEMQLPPPFGPPPFRLPAKDTDLSAWLRDRTWARLSDTWGKLALPRSLVRTPAGAVSLPGTSEFGPAGPRPPAPAR